MSPILTQTPFQRLVKHPVAKILATTALVVGGIAPLAQIAQSATTKGLQQDTVELSTQGKLAQATRNHSRQTAADKKQAARGKKYTESATHSSLTTLRNNVNLLKAGRYTTRDVSSSRNRVVNPSGKKPLGY